MSEIESILDSISASGFLVNNLFQLDDGSWQANLRSPAGATVWVQAPTPTEALTLALDSIESALIPFPESTSSSVLDLNSILSTILSRKTIPSGFKKRI